MSAQIFGTLSDLTSFASRARTLLLAAALAGAPGLSGCTSQSSQGSAGETPAETSRVDAATSPQKGADSIRDIAARIPERELDEQTLALLLEAEFALYSQRVGRALTLYEHLTQKTQDPGVARRSAEIALAGNDASTALDAALVYLDLDPNSDHALGLATRALARAAEVEGAWSLLREREGKTAEVRMMTAEAVRLAAHMKDTYQIEWLLQQILTKYGADSLDTNIQLALGLLYEGLADHERAAEYAAKASTSEPDNVLAVRLHANSLVRAGRTPDAAALITDWVQTQGRDLDARISMAQMLASIDQKAALALLKMLTREYPWTGKLLMATAQLLIATEALDQAIPYYEQLTRFGTYRTLAFFNLGRIHEQTGELPQAADYYDSASSEPGTADDNLLFEAKLRRGRLLYQLGTSGASLFEELRTTYPDQALALYQDQASVLMAGRSYKEAIAVLSLGLEEHPKNEALLYSRSMAYEQSNNIDAAVADLRTLLQQDEDNATALNALGYTLANRTDQYEEAYDLIDRALDIEPDDPAIIDSMGWVLYRMGRYEDALGYLRQAHSELVDEEIISHLAEVLWKLDRPEEARAILDQGIADLPDSTLIPETLKRLGFES